MRPLIIILSFLFCSISIGQIQVSSQLDRKSMKLGEQTTLKVRVTLTEKDSNALVIFPDNNKELLVERADTPMTAFLEVVDFFLDTLKDINTGILSFEKNYIITAWDTGIFVIDTMKILINDSLYPTPSTFIEILDVAVDTTKDIVDIKEIYSEENNPEDTAESESWWSKNWIWITIVGTLLVAGVIGWIFYFRKKQEVIEVKAKLPAHQIALQRLSSLKKKDYIKKGQEKEYYSEITEIIRVYLEDRFDVRALELTTNEIINRLKYTNISPDDKYALREVLETSDLVKFAKMKPSEMDNENALFKAEEFVRHTKMSPEEIALEEDDNEPDSNSEIS